VDAAAARAVVDALAVAVAVAIADGGTLLPAAVSSAVAVIVVRWALLVGVLYGCCGRFLLSASCWVVAGCLAAGGCVVGWLKWRVVEMKTTV